MMVSTREMKRNAGGMKRPEADPARAESGRNRPRSHREETTREKLEEERLSGRYDAVRPVRDGFEGASRIEARRLCLKPPGKSRGCAAAAHLHLNAVSGSLVHGGEVARMFRGNPGALRRKRFGND